MENKNQSNIEQYLHNQVEISNKWKWNETLPLFVYDTTYNQAYYPELSKLGGVVDLAIIQKINNKSLLLRFITGCEEELDIPFGVKIDRNARWDRKNDYSQHLSIRLAAYRKYQLEYTTLDLSKQLRQLKLQDCSNARNIFYFNDIPIVNSPIRDVDANNKLVKGFMYYIGTRSPKDMSIIYSEKDDSTLVKASTDKQLLKQMSEVLEDSFSRNWKGIASGKIEVDSIVKEIDRAMSMRLNEEFVSHYIGPFFELKQESHIERSLIRQALAEKKDYPHYLVKIIKGYAAIIFIEKIQ